VLYLRVCRGGRKFYDTRNTFKLLSTKSFLLDLVEHIEFKPGYLLERLDNLSLSLIGDGFLYSLKPF
jgi:hypothetical protein